MTSIGTRLTAVNLRPSGFDYLRLALSVAVVAFHSLITTYGTAADIAMWGTWLGVPVRMILPMFFALSGFLVAGSLMRCNTISEFLWLRMVRIYPALVVEVLLSALILGPLLTTRPLAGYFADSQLHAYFWNMLGHIHFLLPGVFESNPLPLTVNAQLWTVPFELYCYVTLAVLTAIGIKRSLLFSAVAPILFLACYFGARTVANHGTFPEMGGGVPGWLLVDGFLFGVTLYCNRNFLPWNTGTFFVALIGAIVSARWFHFGVLLLPAFSAYCVVYLGLLNPRRLKFIAGADYSYGIFLYGFVIQQALMGSFPSLRIWWINILLAIPLSAAFAALSWHLVERPALRLKHLHRMLLPSAATVSTKQI